MIHRDIKTENILMKDDGTVLLADFSAADFLKPGVKRKAFVGSPCWMAPEIIE